MRLRATADLHLTAVSAPWVFAALAELRRDAADHGGPTVIAGDILQQATTVHMPTWDRLRRMLLGWPDEVYVIVGNHDMYDATSNALDGLAGPGVRVIAEPTSTPLGPMVPYVHMRDAGDFDDALSAARAHREPGHGVGIVWCHQGIRGAYVNSMRRDRDGVWAGTFGDHIAVAGHYHMPQSIGRVIYCGSPYQRSFAEEGQRKGWLLSPATGFGYEPRRHVAKRKLLQPSS